MKKRTRTGCSAAHSLLARPLSIFICLSATLAGGFVTPRQTVALEGREMADATLSLRTSPASLRTHATSLRSRAASLREGSTSLRLHPASQRSRLSSPARHPSYPARRPSSPGRRPASVAARRALIISLDGLDARYLLKRDEYGLRIPTLRRLIAEGVVADAVVSVYPSVTYPAHMTIVTGATPLRHGIYGNEVFEPPPAPQLASKRWHWFARDIQADTLWQAAARKNLKTGMVSWPGAAGAGDFNVPEIWKAGSSPADSLQVTLAEISAHARPRGLVEEIAARDPEIYARVTKDEGDEMRTRWAEYIIKEKRPALMLVHLFDLDHFQHDFGPFTPRAFEMLEKTDAYVGRLLAAAERAGTLGETAVFIVSDHGFMPISQEILPFVILERAGLLKTGEAPDAKGGTRRVVTDWRALPYTTGGSCAVILRDPEDRDAFKRAVGAFQRYVRPPGRTDEGADAPGILRIIYPQQIERMGVNPRAAFFLEGMEGYSFSDSLAGEPVRPRKPGGTHGYLPTRAGYRASFIASGAGITRRGSLGTINLTDIAPTIARALRLPLRKADGRPLRLTESGQR